MKKFIYFMILMALFMGCTKSPPMIISAKISFINDGIIKVTHEGATKNAEINMKLVPNDIIETGANAELRILFANIGISKIKPNTRIKIEQLLDTHTSEQIRMSITKGRIFSSLKKLTRKKDHFEISTPTAVAGVRGTTFLVDVDPNNKTRTAVFAGKVEIRKKIQAGDTQDAEEVIVIEALKEALIPEADFSKTKVMDMSQETYNEEIATLQEIKEIEEIKELNIPEIKEEIIATEKKWEEVKKEAPKEAPKVVETVEPVEREAAKPVTKPKPASKKKGPEKIQW